MGRRNHGTKNLQTKKVQPASTSTTEQQSSHEFTDIDQLSSDLTKQINKEAGDAVAFNLGMEHTAPTEVKRWISTGSRLLDYVIANKRGGGLPEGRIVEIQGPPGGGKSHLAFEIAKRTQKMGGLVIYFDTENATSIDNLRKLGINVAKGFVFVQSNCTEDIFKYAESAILKTRQMAKDVPVTIIWDSIAGSAPKAELEGDYDQNTIGLQARVLSKGIKKIANIIGNQKVLFVLINQQRTKIGVMYGDPLTTPGGMSIPYACSVRLKLSGVQPIKAGDMIRGITVDVAVIKNKVGYPHRRSTMNVMFGVGINDDEQCFDIIRQYCDTNKFVLYNGKRLKLD
ncbi:MAG: hypothetical protein HC899_38735, partial [Leptolyngbyaceae cyanobacterium SM1_4_3]|nr:hypothetical protein [Leptolyngbyaceae cyanobacterium SM1_4_3]